MVQKTTYSEVRFALSATLVKALGWERQHTLTQTHTQVLGWEMSADSQEEEMANSRQAAHYKESPAIQHKSPSLSFFLFLSHRG